ncbi:MAG: nucleotidyltransferase family protein [Minisyncoccales bacterium]
MSDLENIEKLEKILKKNEKVQAILKLAPSLKMPNWYLGAGCIAQTVWNILHSFEPNKGIRDYDLVYYDSSDLSSDGEDFYIKKGEKLFKDFPVLVEIKNEARVHLWYKNHFGYEIQPYKSVEDAIRTWPTTATSVGVKYGDDKFKIFAPYGLDDLLGMIVKANKIQITKEIYQKKTERWMKIWPKIRVISWNDS